MRNLWSFLWRHKTKFLIAISTIVVFFVIFLGYTLKWEWTGFAGTSTVTITKGDTATIQATPITLWQWIQTLIIPAILVITAYILNQLQNSRTQFLAAETQEEAELTAYMSYISDLMLKENLYESKKEDSVRAIATARTLSVLRRLNRTRQGAVIKFVSEAGLLKDPAIINMKGVNLAGADLKGAYLFTANLEDANLASTDLRDASLAFTSLKNANLEEADLSNVYLFGANLTGAKLFNANLAGARLVTADLTGANLAGANLAGAHIGGIPPEYPSSSIASLRDTTLIDANLTDAYLREVDLRSANLTNADLNNADLREANLEGAIVAQKQLRVAKLQGATMPDGTKHP